MSAADIDQAQARRIARALGLDAADVAHALAERSAHRAALAARRRRTRRWAVVLAALGAAGLVAAHRLLGTTG